MPEPSPINSLTPRNAGNKHELLLSLLAYAAATPAATALSNRQNPVACRKLRSASKHAGNQNNNRRSPNRFEKCLCWVRHDRDLLRLFPACLEMDWGVWYSGCWFLKVIEGVDSFAIIYSPVWHAMEFMTRRLACKSPHMQLSVMHAPHVHMQTQPCELRVVKADNQARS